MEGRGQAGAVPGGKGGALTGLRYSAISSARGREALSAALTGCPMEEAAVLRALEGLDSGAAVPQPGRGGAGADHRLVDDKRH